VTVMVFSICRKRKGRLMAGPLFHDSSMTI